MIIFSTKPSLQSKTARLAAALLALLLSPRSTAQEVDILHDSYLPPSLCAPGLQEYAEYLSSLKSSAINEDVNQELQNVVAAIRSEEQKLADRQINQAMRYLTLIKLGNKYLAKATLLKDSKLAGISRSDRCTKQGRREKFTPATVDLKKALDTFRKAVADFQDLPASDKALYGLIVSLVRLGNENAPQFNNIFQRKYPKSTLAGWAQLALGEYYFQRSEWQAATEAYRLASGNKDDAIKSYAHYKLGWVRVMQLDSHRDDRQEELKKALFDLKTAASYAARNTKRSSRYPLTREALKDLALVWAEDDDIDGASAYFRSASVKPQFRFFLSRLGNRLFAQGRSAEAARAFLRLAKETPNNRESPALYEQILELTFASRNPEWVVEILRDMTAVHLGDSPWQQKFKNDQDAIGRAVKAVEHALPKYASALARAAEANGDKSLLSAAAELHALYLGQFPEAKAAYDIRFAHATTLAKLGKHREAAQQFLTTAKSRGSSGSHYKEAWLAAIREQELVVQAIEQQQLSDGDTSTPRAIPAEFHQLIRLIDEAPKFVPHDEFQAESCLRAAEIFLRYSVLDTAAKRFAKIILDFPETAAGAKAASRLLSDYHKRGDWVALLGWARRLDRIPAINKGPMATQITQYLHEALVMRANSEAQRSNFRDAAQYALAFSNRFPKVAATDAALYNATVGFLRAGALPSGIQTGTRLIENFPQSKYRPEALSALADASAALCNYETAGRYYAQLASSYPQDPRAANALFNAAITQRSLAKHEDSAKLFEDFAQRYPQDKRAPTALIEAAIQYDRAATIASSPGDTIDWVVFNDSTDDGLPPMPGSYAETHNRLRNTAWNLLTLARQRVAGTRSEPEIKRAAAQAMFQMIYKESQPIIARRIAPKKRYAEDAKSRIASVKQLVTKLNEVQTAGDSELLIASHLLAAQLLESMASMLFSPPDLLMSTASDSETLKTQWEKQALDAQESAQRHYDAAAQAAEKSGNLSPWARLAKSKVGRGDHKHASELRELYAPSSFLAFKSGKNATDSEGSLYSLAKRPWRSAKPDAANDEIRTTTETLKNIPRDIANRLRRANAYLYLGRLKEAESDVRKVLSFAHKNPEARQTLAKIALASGKPEQVDSILANFSPTKPSDSEGYVLMALAAAMRSDYITAKELLDAAISLNPNDLAAFVNLGLLYLEFRQLDLAENALEKAQDLSPDDGNILIHLALIKSAAGDYKDAGAMLKKATSQRGDPELIAFNQAVLQQKTGDYDAALQSLGRYSALVQDRPDKLLRAEKLRNTIETARTMKTMMPVILDEN